MHKPIQFKNLSLSFPHKTCFADFNAQILYGSRIALIGRNGCGKSTLLKILQGMAEPSYGEVHVAGDVCIGYVPQLIETSNTLSGGERLNEALTQALSLSPNVLLLDEPTNHLDVSNRKSLIRMLRAFPGTLIIVSHDVELLRSCIDTIWHIDNGLVHVFSGQYDDYIHDTRLKRASVEQELAHLSKQKKEMHQALMKEQGRAAKSRAKGEKSMENRKWPTIVSKAKALRAGETAGNKKAQINHKKQVLSEQLSALSMYEIITPTFSLSAADLGSKTLVSIRDGGVGYRNSQSIVSHITLSLMAGERLALMGDNGSGKSTLIKAIVNPSEVITTGDWIMPKLEDIGFLDQHYENLSSTKTVLETIHELCPSFSHAEVRRHLNDFLFRKNEEVNALVATLSGGEKARLSLAQIAAKTPKLLILDEMTNNLDLETREHVIEVLKKYPGSMIVISHDEDFLRAIDMHYSYMIKDGFFDEVI